MVIAVLGCGSIGRRHLRNLIALGCTDLLAFDPFPNARQVVERETGLSPLDSLGAVWARQPDVVLVCAPPNQHLPLALAAARQGCHLFIEKPLAHTLTGLDALQTEIEQRGLVNMVACNMRFHPGPALIKRLLEQQTIGDIIAARLQFSSYLPRWRPWQDYRHSYTASSEWGGAILDCIHEIDLALWYLGPAAVVAAAHRPATSLGLETDGLAEIILRHHSGVLSSVHLSFVQQDYYRTAQIIGAAGTIFWEFNQKRVLVYGPQGTVAQSYAEPEGWQLNEMYVDQLAHFLRAVEQGAPTINPLPGGRAALAVALAARTKTKVD